MQEEEPRRRGGSVKDFALWRKSTDINAKDRQGLIQTKKIF